MNRYLYLACLIYDCSETDFMSKSRELKLVMARYLFYALAVTKGPYQEAEAIRFMNRQRCMRYHFGKMVDNLIHHDKNFIIKFHYASKILNILQ